MDSDYDQPKRYTPHPPQPHPPHPPPSTSHFPVSPTYAQHPYQNPPQQHQYQGRYVTQEEAFELGYPDLHDVQDLQSAARGAYVRPGGGAYGILPQGAYDDDGSADAYHSRGPTPSNVSYANSVMHSAQRTPAGPTAQQLLAPTMPAAPSGSQYLQPPRAGVMFSPPPEPRTQPQQQTFYQLNQTQQGFSSVSQAQEQQPQTLQQYHQPSQPSPSGPYSVFQAALLSLRGGTTVTQPKLTPSQAPQSSYQLPFSSAGPTPVPTPLPRLAPAPSPSQQLPYSQLYHSQTTPHPYHLQDPEAYAQVAYSSSSRYNQGRSSGLRSRSPTPELEDDDACLPLNHSQLYSSRQQTDQLALLDRIEEDGDGDLGQPSPSLDDDHLPPAPLPPLQPYDYTHTKGASSPATYYDSPVINSYETQHFGPAPEGRVLRRNKTKTRRRIALTTQGNLVVESAVPTELVGRLPVRDDPERASMTYTAVTCGPDEFGAKGFSLRQQKYDRKTEIFIVITMYSENEQLFLRTLYGIMKNIGQLCNRQNSSWGRDGWKRVVVCIVADGRTKIHPKVLDVLTILGVYRDGLMKNTGPKDVPVQAHLFEYTTSFALDPNFVFDYGEGGKGKNIVPCQIMFCLKENNAKKINSHRWFFNAFAPLLEPNVCILLDVGTMPGPRSIYKLWKVFDLSSNVGGACGEIAAYKARGWKKLLNPLVASQNFEYKMSNILDKPTESAFGYISVLPGAFSAYRYRALQNGPDGQGPLQKYFLGEDLHGDDDDAGVFTKNMYLAEDRILCFELICARSPWVLRYVKDAVGETDVPEDFTEFILQRRRWLNGSLFATIYALYNTKRIWRSEHGFWRKCMFMVEAMYNMINLVFSWFAIANFYIFFVILTSSLEDKSFGVKGINYFNVLCQYLYLGLLVSCFLFSMGNRPKGSKIKYLIAIYGFAFLTCYMLVAAILCTIKAAEHPDEPIYFQMIISVLATYGVYVVSSLMAWDPWHIITSFLQYILLSPTYINVLSIYAFSNLHDFTWGTKGDDNSSEPKNDLGSVQSAGHGTVAVDLPDGPADANESYAQALASIRELKHPSVPIPSAIKKVFKHKKPKLPRMMTTAANLVGTATGEKKPKTKDENMDYYANFRTNVLLSWVLTNGVLAAGILSGGGSASFSNAGSKQAVYMVFVLCFVAATSVIRFLGSTVFLVVRLFTGN